MKIHVLLILVAQNDEKKSSAVFVPIYIKMLYFLPVWDSNIRYISYINKLLSVFCFECHDDSYVSE